ncbi:porin [Chitinasiproducens palmae]|uniref:Outer membrane protein (Porin) n=1 Tax=Chitinasiproducens palmae TaxID=1770053 RepID=A0A1H2PVI9_9BURK|nr:porin [Chitinasiproducens palmae]SDV51303.1 Outer membrane protein (porin) [Chitinasiproducens palmae]
MQTKIGKTLGASFVTLSCASPCLAQSGVTLYGVIDEGVTWTSNQAGGHAYQMQSGVTQGSRWGLLGKEDLGGGLRAIFALENGFDPSAGGFGQNGRLFGRQAYVGLSSNAGTLTLGRQYEFMADFVAPVSGQGQWGTYFSHAGDVDNLNGSFRVNNAVKYTSPTLGGFKLGALYSFGGQAGAFSTNSVLSLGINYGYGPLYVAAAYTRVNSPYAAAYDSLPKNVLYTRYLPSTTSESIYGLGASYTFGAFKMGLDASQVTFRAGFNGANVDFRNVEGWLNYAFATTLSGGLGYTWTDVDVHASGAKPRYQQVNLMLDYALSKRTDVYAMAACLSGSSGTTAQINYVTAASSSNRQSLLRLGLRHKF